MYLLRDNRTVACEQDLVRDHDLIRRAHTQGILNPDRRANDEWQASIYRFEGPPSGDRNCAGHDHEHGAAARVYPAAVVIPLEDEAGSNDLLDGNLQIVTETIGVIVEFDASADRRGQAGVSPVEAMKYALFRALLSWVIDPERGARGLFYAGGELLTFDRARLFWMYRMSFEATISDADGFVPRGDPLTNITETIQPDDPIKLATPIVAEEAVGGTVAVWGGFVWDDGDVWG